MEHDEDKFESVYDYPDKTFILNGVTPDPVRVNTRTKYHTLNEITLLYKDEIQHVMIGNDDNYNIITRHARTYPFSLELNDFLNNVRKVYIQNGKLCFALPNEIVRCDALKEDDAKKKKKIHIYGFNLKPETHVPSGTCRGI